MLRGGAAVMWHGHKAEFPYFQGGPLQAPSLHMLSTGLHYISLLTLQWLQACGPA